MKKPAEFEMSPRNLKGTLLRSAAICAGASIFLSTSAYAQASGTDEQPMSKAPSPQTAAGAEAADSDIIVTGIRASIGKSLAEKRGAVNVVDVISAEDIGKFPDNNIAEALQRVPGITIDRTVLGEGQSINLRGLGSQFTRSAINGGTALNGFDFSVLAPELFSRITVEKSPTAATVEGALAGTILQETPKPFDMQGFRGSFIAGLSVGQKAPDTPRFFGLVSKNWDDKFGVTIAGAYSKTNFITNEVDYGPWAPFRLIASADALATAPQELLNAATPRTAAYYSYQQKRQNYGLSVAAQARPTERLELTADFLFARKNGAEIADRPDLPVEGTSFFANNTSSPGVGVPVNYTIENGAVTAATFRNIQNRVGYSYQPQETQVYQAGLRGKWTPTDSLTIDGGISRAEQKTTRELDLFSYAINGADLTYKVNGDIPQFSSSVTNFSTRPEDFRFNVFIFNRAKSKVTENVAQLNFTQQFDGPLSSIQWGGRYTDRDSTQLSEAASLNQGSPTLTGKPLGLDAVATSLPFSVGGANTPSTILSVDKDKLESIFYPGLDPFTSNQFTISVNSARLATFAVNEKTLAGYLQANFEIGDVKVGIGGRGIQTWTDANGVRQVRSQLTPVNTKGSYFNFLPSFNARWEVTPNLLIRGAVSKALTRPTLAQLSPATVINPGPRTGTRGNPDLRPYEAWQEDLGFEWYFGDNALFTVGGFAKQITSLIAQTTVYEVATFPDQITGQPTQGQIAFTQPANGNRANVKGVEIGLQTPFVFLPGAFKDAGFILNYTYASSESTTRAADGTTRTTPLPGLSKNSANAVLYYDTKAIDARLAYAWRSTYLRTDPVGLQFGAERYIRSYGQFDLSINANLTDRFSIGFDVNNLLDTKRKEYTLIASGAEMPASYLEQERRFVATGRVKF